MLNQDYLEVVLVGMFVVDLLVAASLLAKTTKHFVTFSRHFTFTKLLTHSEK
jgi:hypothetical protein